MAQFIVYTNHPYLWLIVDYSWGTSDIPNNRTPLTVRLTLHHQAADVKAGNNDCAFSIAGSTVQWTGADIKSSGTKDTVLGERSVWITHGADGKFAGALAVSYRFMDRYGSYTIQNPIMGSQDITAPDIARASVPTLSARSVNLQSKVTISTNRKSASFTHNLYYSVGSSGKILFASDVADNYAWTPRYQIAQYFKTAVSAAMTIYCETYNGSAKVGETQVPITVTMPDNADTRPVMGPVFSPISTLPAVFNGIYVQGKTGLRCEFNATGVFADIASCVMTVENKSYSGVVAECAKLNTAGNAVPVRLSVTDSRGFVTTKSMSIPVNAYTIPRISGITCDRTDESGDPLSGGACLRLAFTSSCASIGGRNTCSASMKYRRGSGGFSGETQLTGNPYTNIFQNLMPDADSTYQVQVILRDTIGEETVYSFDFASAFHTMHLARGGRGVAFGKKSTKDAFECAMPAEFEDTVTDSTGNQVANIATVSLVYRPDFDADTWTDIPCDWDQYEFLSIIPTYYNNHYAGMFIPSSIGRVLTSTSARVIFMEPCTYEIYFQPGKVVARKNNGDNFSFIIYGISRKGR